MLKHVMIYQNYDQLRKANSRRARAVRDTAAALFRKHSTQIHDLCKQALGGLYIGTRSGKLLQGERLRFIGKLKSEIYNKATSFPRYGGQRYGFFVHDGTPDHDRPSKYGHKALYVYTSGGIGRPRTPGGWKALGRRAMTKVHVTRRLKGKKTRPWRNIILDKLRVNRHMNVILDHLNYEIRARAG